MRKNQEDQLPLSPIWPDHELAEELRMISRILDENPEILDAIVHDLSDSGAGQGGARGLSAEQVLRCAVIKNWHQFSCRTLAFHLADSMSFRNFCRLPLGWAPSKACLAGNIRRVSSESWRQVNDLLMQWAAGQGLEDARRVRGDSTAVEAPIHHPTDSALLADGIRVLGRLLKELCGHAPVAWSDHGRRAKTRHLQICKARGMKGKKPLYRDLLKISGWTLEYVRRALAQTPCGPQTAVLLGRLQHYAELMERVIEQTERRVFQGEQADQKLVSIFEEHADVVKKKGGDPTFGHKVFLSVGRSSLVLDCRVERGNPADERQFQPMLKRVESLFGRMPEQVGFDGGFSSGANLDWAKGKGVRDVSFPRKGKKMKIEEMVSSSWIARRLRRFRAGVEGVISWAKRIFGLDRCTWKGWKGFKRCVHLSVLSLNLLTLARLRLRS